MNQAQWRSEVCRDLIHALETLLGDFSTYADLERAKARARIALEEAKHSEVDNLYDAS